jgi:hypothetical protein
MKSNLKIFQNTIYIGRSREKIYIINDRDFSVIGKIESGSSREIEQWKQRK